MSDWQQLVDRAKGEGVGGSWTHTSKPMKKKIEPNICLKRGKHIVNSFDYQFHDSLGEDLKCQDCGAVVEAVNQKEEK